MDHVWQYISDYSESTFDDLRIEFESGKFADIKACPSYHDCECFSKSMNDLDVGDKGELITPQNEVLNFVKVEKMVFEVSNPKNDTDEYFQVTLTVDLESHKNLMFDRFRIKTDEVDGYKSLDELIYNKCLDYYIRFGINVYFNWTYLLPDKEK